MANSNNKRETDGTDQCEDYRDCVLPDTAEDGEVIVCENCGKDWEYEDGWFTPVEDSEADSDDLSDQVARHCENCEQHVAARVVGRVVKCIDCGQIVEDNR